VSVPPKTLLLTITLQIRHACSPNQENKQLDRSRGWIEDAFGGTDTKKDSSPRK
jgi:hypothetical protein